MAYRRTRFNNLVNIIFACMIIYVILSTMLRKKEDKKKTINNYNCNKHIKTVYSNKKKRYYINRCIAKQLLKDNYEEDDIIEKDDGVCIEIDKPVYIIYNDKLIRYSNDCVANNHGFYESEQIKLEFKWFDNIDRYEKLCYNGVNYINIHHLWLLNGDTIKISKIKFDTTCSISCIKIYKPVEVVLKNQENKIVYKQQYSNECVARANGFWFDAYDKIKNDSHINLEIKEKNIIF